MTNQAFLRAVRPATAIASTAAGELTSDGSIAVQIAEVYETNALGGAQRLRALAAPLQHRFRRGEGGLLVVNATLAWRWHSLAEAFALTVISLICLASLYLFNDIVDGRDDQQNPKKDRFTAGIYVRERGQFLAIWLSMTAFAIALATLLDARAAFWVLSVSVINVAYSLLLKRIPVLDVAWVGLWGSAYACIVTNAPAWIVMVAAMTAVCHIYQISEDHHPDIENGIATSATLARQLLSLLQIALAAIIAAAAWTLNAGLIAPTFAAFLAYWLIWRERPQIAWILSKAHFSIVWAYLLLLPR